MTPDALRAFAGRHRLRLRRDELGELVVPGRFGFLYAYSSRLLAVTYTGESVRAWRSRRRKWEEIGMTVIQDGDTEGTALLDLDNDAQAVVATTTIRAKRKRIASPAQLEALARARQLLPNTAQRHHQRAGSANAPPGASEVAQQGRGDASARYGVPEPGAEAQ